MLKMTEISNIRNLYFEEGKNITEINRITGKDRKTIKHYIEKDDWNKPEESGKNEETFPKLDPYKEEIDKWLTDDKKAKKKQRHTATRVFNRLVEKYNGGFDCSYRTVAGYFAVRKKEIFNGWQWIVQCSFDRLITISSRVRSSISVPKVFYSFPQIQSSPAPVSKSN